VCASTNGTLYLNTQLAAEFLSPNAPPVNQFPSTSVDANNKFWSASGKMAEESAIIHTTGSHGKFLIQQTHLNYHITISTIPGLLVTLLT
jgi:hypothetical protein